MKAKEQEAMMAQAPGFIRQINIHLGQLVV